MLDKTKLKEEIAKYIQGCNQGYFVTIDTQYTTDKLKMDRAILDKLNKFTLEINEIFRPLQIYAFGRNFRRHEMRNKQTLPALPVSFEYKIKGVTAYEIGNGGRLHLHSMLLHNGSCNRTVIEVESRLRKICSFNKHTRLRGKNALQVKLYDANRENDWIHYFMKSTDYFWKYYDGFCNIDFI